MKHIYPCPKDVGIQQNGKIIQELFDAGFQHAVRGNNITEVPHLKLSFREGYRAAKLYLRELRKEEGIHNFPLQGKMTIKAA